MKRRIFKLFLIFGAIVLSLLSFASCKETPPENPPSEENQEEDVYRKEIKDSEYIEFVLNNYDIGVIYDYFGPYPSGFFYAYTNFQKNNSKVKEYKTSDSTRIIAGYIPREWVETIFETDSPHA